MSNRRIHSDKPPDRIKILLEEPEDVWHAYNLILPSDHVTAYGSHRVTTESSTGSTVSNRVYTQFTIRVKSIDFDPGASELHLSGQIVKENSFARLGQHQTLHLKVSDHFTLEKKDDWDTVTLEVLRELTDRRKRAEKSTVVMAVVMQEGLANICAVTDHRTILKQRINVAIPRKRQGGTSAQDERMTKFFDQTLTALLRHANMESEQPILLASPGFTAAGFLSYILSDKASNNHNITASLRDNKSKFIVAHSSSGHLHALYEVMKSPEILGRIHHTKFAHHARVMDEFMTLLRRDDGWAWYGPGEVRRAVERGAVGKGGGKLLISLGLFRATDLDTRKRYVGLVESVRDYGGDVLIFSDEGEAGKKLVDLGGVAAVLTFPLEDLEEPEPEQEEGGG